MLTSEDLEGGLHTHIVAHLQHEVYCEISNLIVSDNGEPPVGQFKAWSMVNDLPHSHVGNRGGCHPYLKQRVP